MSEQTAPRTPTGALALGAERAARRERVAAIDLETKAVPTLVGWIRERLEAHKPMDAWVPALRPAVR